MKKMSKFRKRLIHKLGGVLLEDKPIIVKEARHTKTFESTVVLSFYDYQCLCENNPFDVENHIKKELWDKLGEQIIPTLYKTRTDNPIDMITTFKAKLTIIEE